MLVDRWSLERKQQLGNIRQIMLATASLDKQVIILYVVSFIMPFFTLVYLCSFLFIGVDGVWLFIHSSRATLPKCCFDDNGKFHHRSEYFTNFQHLLNIYIFLHIGSAFIELPIPTVCSFRSNASYDIWHVEHNPRCFTTFEIKH